ncbi:MAG: ABC-F family ATP-binding cassette domain-containing protein [Fusobacteria bacterium]|nr:ABC-F family ATP-binding cassette domain-containing protein [Fusobacteriota bacterium]
MTLVQFSAVDREYGAEKILEDISFALQESDKVGLIGVNGCGKTTLIKTIMDKYIGKEHLEKGSISLQKNLSIGYLSQNVSLNYENSIIQEMELLFSHIESIKAELKTVENDITSGREETLQRHGELISKLEFLEGFDYHYKIDQVLFGIGFVKDELSKKIEVLSGGEKNRVALAKILLSNPDLLILDEPTNHLDITGIEWLEEYLVKFNKAILVVSHDRYFLDRVTNKTFEIENRKLCSYNGNFSKFVELKREKILSHERAFEKQQKEIKATEAYILKYKAGIKSKQARGRSKQLARLERIDKVYNQDNISKFRFEIRRVPTDKIFQLEKFTLFGGKKLLAKHISFSIYNGERVGILGKNGTGKSTLLKYFENPLLSEELILGSNLEIGYFDQNHTNLDFSSTVYNELRYNFPLNEEQIRSILSNFLFEEGDLSKKISVLSGGERAKLSLIKLSLQKPNVLVLDEPTNHLDIYSKEILIDSLLDYEGTLVVVSHDRYFLQTLVDKMLIIQDERVTIFDGDFEAYKASEKRVEVQNSDKEEQVLNYQETKALKNRSVSLEKKVAKGEERITELESEKQVLENLYEDAGRKNEVSKLLSLQEAIATLESSILEAFDEWETLLSEFESLKS